MLSLSFRSWRECRNTIFEFLGIKKWSKIIELPHCLTTPVYLGSDRGGSDVGGGAVLSRGHAAVLLLLLFLLTLHSFVFSLAVGRARGRRRGQWGRRWGQILQLIGCFLHLDDSLAQQVYGVRKSRKDELETLLWGKEEEYERKKTTDDQLNKEKKRRRKETSRGKEMKGKETGEKRKRIDVWLFC